MATEHGHSQEIDLDRTDRLPILEGVELGGDYVDDAVRMETPLAPVGSVDFMRPSPIDLPSLAESVRSVEERIARQSSEYETLNRSFQRSRDAEQAASARVVSLERDILGLRTALEAEKNRSREQEKALSDKSAAFDTARTRTDEALREADRHQAESSMLRDSLASREATVAQVLHSLGERDAQLAALKAEHGRMLPTLEAREKSTVQLESDLTATRSQLASITTDLKSTREGAAALRAQMQRHEAEAHSTRAELGEAKSRSTTFMELLSTRAWRAGFDQNLYLELDARVSAADRGTDNRAKLEALIAEQVTAIEKLRSTAASHASALAEKSRELKLREVAHSEVGAKLTALQTQFDSLTANLAARDKALAEARAAASADVQRVTEMLAAAERGKAEQATEIAKLQMEHAGKLASLQSDAESQEQEMAVLMAHLKEARRPIEVIEAEVARLNEQIAAKTVQIEALGEENKKLTATLERTKGALEEREFLIRRLERSESNNANALGRIQTSMERLGSVVAVTPTPAQVTPEWQPELIRIDGERSISHTLARRTRIGRASTCELQIDSSSVSRHHALVVIGPREVIIEDLNSTNGVIVNSRKVTRHVLSEGDVINLGDIVFKFAAHPEGGALEAPATPKLPPAE